MLREVYTDIERHFARVEADLLALPGWQRDPETGLVTTGCPNETLFEQYTDALSRIDCLEEEIGELNDELEVKSGDLNKASETISDLEDRIEKLDALLPENLRGTI